MTQYAELLRNRQVRAVTVASLLNGPSLGVPLALVLAVSGSYSFAAAGTVLAVNSIALGASSPVRGRLIDRYGQVRPIVCLAVLHATALCAVAALVATSAPLIAVAACAALAGAPAPLLGALRALWPDLLRSREKLTEAYAFQSVLNELLYVIAPLAVSAVAAVASATWALVVLATSHLAGALAFAATPTVRRWRSEPTRGRSWWGALHAPGMQTLALVNVTLGLVFGALYVSVSAFAEEHGASAAAGLIIAGLSAGSVAGGLVYGAHRWQLTTSGRLRALLLAQLLILAPLPLASGLPMLALLMVLAGTVFAPLLAVCFALIDDVTPTGTATEATAWVVTSYAVGTAIGSAASGAVVGGYDARAGLAVAVAGAAAGCGVYVARARTLSVVARVGM